MKVTLESTTKIVELNGVPARIWEGTTDTGIQVHAFITRINIDKDEPNAQQFETELRECKPPSAKVAQSYPISLIL